MVLLVLVGWFGLVAYIDVTCDGVISCRNLGFITVTLKNNLTIHFVSEYTIDFLVLEHAIVDLSMLFTIF